MIWDMICYIGIAIAALFGIGVIIAMAMVAAMVTQGMRNKEDEHRR